MLFWGREVRGRLLEGEEENGSREGLDGELEIQTYSCRTACFQIHIELLHGTLCPGREEHPSAQHSGTESTQLGCACFAALSNPQFRHLL